MSHAQSLLPLHALADAETGEASEACADKESAPRDTKLSALENPEVRPIGHISSSTLREDPEPAFIISSSGSGHMPLVRPSSAARALEAVRGACEARGVAAPHPASVLDITRTASRWTLEGLRGSVVELSSGSALTASMEIVLQAQESGEPVAWISATSSHFCPDDVANQGIDLSALAVVRVPQVFAAVRAAELLLRSGGFGALVVDMGVSTCIPDSAVGKLVKLSQRFDAAVICVVGGRADQTLGSLVSLRVEADRLRADPGRYRCRIRSTKDKRHGAGWQTEEVYHGPPGLR